MKGCSLKRDLRILINNPKYSDIEILCEDEKKLYASRVILAARSEVFDSLLYNGMKETYENQISFPTIDSVVMEIIIEYIYAGSVKVKSLTNDNIIGVFYAADYFQLSDLKDFIANTVKNTNNFASPELLSVVTKIMPLTEDNILLNSLVKVVAATPLDTIEFGRLSIASLKYLLSYTYEEEIAFASPEYEVFRYSVLLAAKQVSNDAYITLMELLPPLEQLNDSYRVENNFIIDQKVVKKLKPLIEFIDFRRIDAQIIVNIIEPLKIIPIEIILSAYRNMALSKNSDLSNIRGILINESDCIWDSSACGSRLSIEDNGKIVLGSRFDNTHQSVRGKILIRNKGIYEWDVIIEKICKRAWIGVCSSENFNYQKCAKNQSTGWVLGSNGHCCNSGVTIRDYCSSFRFGDRSKFGDGTKVTVHLDMNKRTCAFSVNGIKYQEVSKWTNLPSKLYPVVSIRYPGCFRIQPHQK